MGMSPVKRRRWFERRPIAPGKASDHTPETAGEVWKLLALVNEWIRHSDAKAGVTLTFTGVLAVMTYNLVSAFTARYLLFDVVVIASCLSLLATGLFCALTLIPRLSAPGIVDEKPNLLYFGSIASVYSAKPEEYARELSRLVEDHPAMIQELARQVVVNSHIAHVKSKWVVLSMRTALTSGALVGVIALLVGIGHS